MEMALSVQEVRDALEESCNYGCVLKKRGGQWAIIVPDGLSPWEYANVGACASDSGRQYVITDTVLEAGEALVIFIDLPD